MTGPPDLNTTDTNHGNIGKFMTLSSVNEMEDSGYEVISKSDNSLGLSSQTVQIELNEYVTPQIPGMSKDSFPFETGNMYSIQYKFMSKKVFY